MSGIGLGTLSIGVVSQESTSIDDAFVSVTSDQTIDHGRSNNGSISFTPESDSMVTVTVHHQEYRPQTKVLPLSSNRLKQRIKLPERTIDERLTESIQGASEGEPNLNRKRDKVEEAEKEFESITENRDDPRSVYFHVLRAHQSLCAALSFLDRTVAQGSVSGETAVDEVSALAADIEALEQYADLLAADLDVLIKAFDSGEATEEKRQNNLSESDVVQVHDFLADFNELPTVKKAVGPCGGSLAQFGDFVDERIEVYDDSEPGREALLEAVERLADELERVPSHDDVRSEGQYNLNIYYDKFGSLSDVIEATDIDQRKIFANDVRAVSNELGKEPTTAEYDVHGEYTAGRLKSEFRTWKSALNHAQNTTIDDVEGWSSTSGDRITDSAEETCQAEADANDDPVNTSGTDGQRAEMLSIIVDRHDELGRVPKASHLPGDVPFDRQDYLDQFGGWYEAVEATELDYRAELLQDIRDVTTDLGHSPDTVEMDEHGRYDHTDVYRFFDTWGEAKEAAEKHVAADKATADDSTSDSAQQATPGDGEDSDDSNDGDDRERMMAIVVDLHNELGRAPKASHLPDDAPFTPQDYVDQFEGWYEALERAGLDHRGEVLQAIRDVAAELGHQPTTGELSEHSRYDSGDVYRHFDTWSEAKEAAGVVELDEQATNDDRDTIGGDGQDNADAEVETDAERELLEAVRTVARKLGRSPSLTDLFEHSRYDLNDVYDQFESWDDLKQLAGVSTEASVAELLDENTTTESTDSPDEMVAPSSELAELYETFHRLSRTVDAVVDATDGSVGESPMASWRDALYRFVQDGVDDWEDGYGPQQRNVSDTGIQEYREVYGDGDHVTDFQVIETAALDPVVEAVLERLDLDEHVQSLRLPVAPESGEIPPLFVESDREREIAESLLTEFPANPTVDDWEWVSGGEEREPNEGQSTDNGDPDDVSAYEALLGVSGVTESEADSLYTAGFESVEDLREATVDEISETKRISSQLALRIKADVGGS